MTPLVEALGAQAMESVLIDKVALRRMAQAEDIARVIVFLMSDEAGYISGTVSTPSRPRLVDVSGKLHVLTKQFSASILMEDSVSNLVSPSILESSECAINILSSSSNLRHVHVTHSNCCSNEKKWNLYHSFVHCPLQQ